MRLSNKNTISVVQLAKWSACLYIIISRAFLPLGFVGGSVHFAALVASVLLTISIDHGKPRLNKFLKIEILFIIVTFLTGILVAKSNSWLFNTMQTLLYGFFFGYVIIRISMVEKSCDWFIIAWVISGIILVGYIFLTGGYSVGKLARITAREGMNANTLGVYMTFSVWGMLYLISKSMKKKENTIAILMTGIVIITSFLYIIFGTGSRKAFIASLVVILYWAIFSMIPSFKQISFSKRLLSFIVAAGLILFLYHRFGSAFQGVSTTLNYRMQMLSNENITDMHRMDLIKDALKVFVNHPLFGVGWNNYRLYSFTSQYSHCTYVEVLACTGVVGSVFAYYLWVILIKNIVAFSREKSNRIVGINLISLLAVFLFINAVQILYYNLTLLLIMHLLVAIPLVGKNDLP